MKLVPVLASVLFALLGLVLVGELGGCSTTDAADDWLAGSDGGAVGASGDTCASPNDGCSCSTVGASVSCGRVEMKTDGFTQCSYGTRTCGADGAWSTCQGEIRTDSLVAVPAALHPLGLQGTSAECGDADPCDPYCNGYTDTPIGISPLPGGFVIGDGGLTITSVDAGMLPGTLETTANGDSTCGAAANVHGGACSGNPITSCQQDFRCDLGTNSCVWNGGQGYHDTTAGGVDLTLGTACSYGAISTFPLCNRGSATLPEGTAISVTFVPGTTQPDGCTAAGAPTCTTVAPAGGLVAGACLNVPCSIPETGGFAIVNAGDPGMLEASGRCGNNVAFAEAANADGGTSCASCTFCDTEVQGIVHDPGSNVGLRDVTVYELAAAAGGVVPPIADNAGGGTAPPCDTCDSLLPPSSINVATTTAVQGAFTLKDVTPGPGQTLIAQTGRWRRSATVDIPACQTTVIDSDALRLPRNRGEGDIPKMAMVIGAAESLECWLLKLGLSTSEITRFQGASDASRIQLFREGGQEESAHDGFSAGTPPSADASLWSGSGALNEYSAVVMGCDGYVVPETNTAVSTLVDYANAGGRLFMDHWYEGSFLNKSMSPWNTSSIATWTGGGTEPDAPAQGKVMNGTTAQQHMYDWLSEWAPYTPGPGAGWLESDNPRYDAIAPGSATTTWIRGQTENHWSTDPSGNYALSFSYETPAGAASTCGRVLFNDMHVSQSRAHGISAAGDYSGSQKFPDNCDLSFDLTSEEKALEYQFFQLTACALGGAPPTATPPPPPTLASATFTRDYSATCPDGYDLVWQAFNWQASIPSGTTIQFRAATAATEADLPLTPAAAPTTVPVGTADTTVLSPYWATDMNTVSWHLLHEPPGPAAPSLAWLRVYMVFEPTATDAPILYDWQQLYDCVPSQ